MTFLDPVFLGLEKERWFWVLSPVVLNMTLPGEFFIENSKKQQHEKGGYEGMGDNSFNSSQFRFFCEHFG